MQETYVEKDNNNKNKPAIAAVNSSYKDTVFRKLFSKPDKLLELYNALNNSCYTEVEELEINTLDNAVYLGMKNDVSFIFHNELSLYEHQSTVNPNMPFRNLIYVSDILRKKFYDKSIYSHKLIILPSPRFVVFYNGKDSMPERYIRKLSDSYAKLDRDMDADIFLELKVLVININGCYNEDIKKSCKTLADYQTYVSLIRKYALELPVEDAVGKAIDECIKNNVLREFLEKERAEVMALSVFEFDKEREFRIVREDERQMGREEGFNVGMKQGIEQGIEQGIRRGIENFLKQALKYGEAEDKAIKDAAEEFRVEQQYVHDIMDKVKATD